MKLQIILILITALVSAASSETVIIETVPPGGSIWVGEEFTGKSPVTLTGVETGEVIKIAVHYGSEIVTGEYIISSENTEIIIVIDHPPRNSFKPEGVPKQGDIASAGLGILGGIFAGALGPFVAFFIIAALAAI